MIGKFDEIFENYRRNLGIVPPPDFIAGRPPASSIKYFFQIHSCCHLIWNSLFTDAFRSGGRLGLTENNPPVFSYSHTTFSLITSIEYCCDLNELSESNMIKLTQIEKTKLICQCKLIYQMKGKFFYFF